MSTPIRTFDSFEPELPAGPAHRPQSLAEIDVPQAVLESLALKSLYLSGPLSVLDLSDNLRVSFEVTTALYYRLRAEQLCQASGMDGNIPQIAITAQGRARAMEALSQCQYVGAAPVSLASYVEITRKQSVMDAHTSPAAVDRAFAHLVIGDETLRQLGTALNSGSSIFLYGPPGTGKTSMAEAMSRALANDHIWLPYAVEVDGQIITIYDPAVHVRVPDEEPPNCDKRWLVCSRPAVLVGGELTVEMLDLQFNPNTKYYVGPAQMKANNGVLIIDDFGRQRIRPDELLNRWVVPLDRRIDFLTLAGGKKIEIPFEMLVVFASNMNPFDLVDASFLRRIHTKIKVGAVSSEQFIEIFRRVAADRRVPFDPEIPDALINFIQRILKQELRSCYPRDIVEQACWAARYENRKPYLDLASLKQAVNAYFLAPE
jgi:predicted ATPase with chaperone activity